MNSTTKSRSYSRALLSHQKVAGIDLLLSRVSRRNSILLLIAVCSGMISIGFLVVRDLRSTSEEAHRIYSESIRGMQQVGELQYDAQETRRTILYALTTTDSNLQLVYADQTREADKRVMHGISQYACNAKTPEQTNLAAQLKRDWGEYLFVRDDVLALILEGSIHDAVTRDLDGGVPKFERVRKELEQVKRLYGDEAERSGRSLEELSKRLAWRLAGFLSFTLLLGSAAIWAIQRAQLLGRIQLARLQMEFVASVSHELRTPLAVIRSAADNVADGIVNTPEALCRYGTVLQNQSRKMGELIDQVLLFASVEQGAGPLPTQALSIDQVIGAVMPHAEGLEKESGVRILVKVDAGLPRAIGNLQGITQVLTNLLGNAVKYGGSDRLVTLHAFASDAKRDGPRQACISVRDRGMGIDSAEIDRVFEPFYRGSRVKGSQIHGTGLGLSVARRIAESMEGEISVSSEMGRGSTFTLHLKAATDGAAQSRAHDAPRQSAGVQ